MSPRDLAERIIVALDVPDPATALWWVERLPQVRWWKVGLELFTAAGPDILTQLKRREKSIFLDLKYHDIPQTLQRACQVAVDYGVDFLTLHATAGSQALVQAQATVAPSSLKLLAVTLLTSLGAAQFTQEFASGLGMEDYILHWARVAQGAGLAGVICAPQEVPLLKPTLGMDFLCVCPGIRWPNPGVLPPRTDDQQRTCTPPTAFALGADYLVIGRPILQADDPDQVWQNLMQSHP